MASRGGCTIRPSDSRRGQLQDVIHHYPKACQGCGGALPKAGGEDELRRRMHSLERRFGRLLRKGRSCPEGKAAKFCANLLRFEESLWTFVRRKGVEPTNNLAEWILRSLVLRRKISFGCHSGKGYRFVERVLTVTQTLNKL